jgi:hypothetical protein
MNYQAFTNASLTMMYHAVRGAMAADDVLAPILVRNASFASGRPRSGRCTLLPSKLKCVSGECFSWSSIGRKIESTLPFEE